MIIRGTRLDLFIRSNSLGGMFKEHAEIPTTEYNLIFDGVQISLLKEEMRAIIEGFEHLENNPYDRLVFEKLGETYDPKYNMKKWIITDNKGHSMEIKK